MSNAKQKCEKCGAVFGILEDECPKCGSDEIYEYTPYLDDDEVFDMVDSGEIPNL